MSVPKLLQCIAFLTVSFMLTGFTATTTVAVVVVFMLINSTEEKYFTNFKMMVI